MINGDDQLSFESVGSLPKSLAIKVCLLTYKRPELLGLTLKSLMGLETQATVGAEAVELAIQIVVIDNDAAMTGWPIVEEASKSLKIALTYVSEPARGLSTARNRALQESSPADYVAFIDDDEVAHSNWLKLLVESALLYKGDVVTGPVHPKYDKAPEWVVHGGYFAPQQRESGSIVPFVATNNVLIRGEVAQTFRFDSRFDATGGEDTDFFMRIARAGHRIVWAQDAIVTEVIPTDRANLRWLLSRARSDANRFTRSCLLLDSGVGTRLRRGAIALAGFASGVALLPGIIVGRYYAVRGLQLISRSIGTLSALRGKAQIYYKATDGQ